MKLIPVYMAAEDACDAWYIEFHGTPESSLHLTFHFLSSHKSKLHYPFEVMKPRSKEKSLGQPLACMPPLNPLLDMTVLGGRIYLGILKTELWASCRGVLALSNALWTVLVYLIHDPS